MSLSRLFLSFRTEAICTVHSTFVRLASASQQHLRSRRASELPRSRHRRLSCCICQVCSDCHTILHLSILPFYYLFVCFVCLLVSFHYWRSLFCQLWLMFRNTIAEPPDLFFCKNLCKGPQPGSAINVDDSMVTLDSPSILTDYSYCTWTEEMHWIVTRISLEVSGCLFMY
jgi:hypothetical protein